MPEDITSKTSAQTLAQALTLTANADGRLRADLHGDFSNGPVGAPPEAGFPFGGLLATLCGEAMRQGLGLTAPLRSLSVQYLAAARFGEPIEFKPRLLRGGRSIAYATVESGQGGRLTHHASATFGADGGPTTPIAPLAAPPPPLDSLDSRPQLRGPMVPRFSRHVEYRFDGGPHILGGNAGRPAVERLWMRCGDGQPLDTPRLCYLLDAIYPPAWTLSPKPAAMATVDLRYDILTDPTPEHCPGGWAFFEFRMLDLGRGWTVDEAVAWGVDGTPLALSRQRRKLAPERPPSP